MKVGILFSGGKDSHFAMYKAKQKEEVVCLISIISKNPESYMFHTPNIHLVELQAKALGLPIVIVETEGEKESELKDLEKAVKIAVEKYEIEGVTTGALASEYQASRVKKICEKLNLKSVNPLWGMDQEKLMREIISSGFKVIVTHIAALGLDESWLGKEITNEDVDKLVEINKRMGINIAFEGGEAETLAIDGPIFKSKLVIKEAKKEMQDENTGTYVISRIELE